MKKEYIICKRSERGQVGCIQERIYNWRTGSTFNWNYHVGWSSGLARVFNEPPIKLAKEVGGFIVKANSPKCPVEIQGYSGSNHRHFKNKKK